jgi:hypothetical protein
VKCTDQKLAKIMTITGPAGQLGVSMRPEQDERVPAVLNHIVSCNDDRHFHLDGVVDCRPKIDVLAQYNDRFDGGPAAGYFLDVSRDPDTARAVDHLLLNDAARLSVEFTQEDVAPGRLDLLPVAIVIGVLARQIAEVTGPSECETNVNGRDVQVVTSKCRLHPSDRRPNSDASGVASLVEHVAAVHDCRRHGCQRNRPPIPDSLRQRHPPALLSRYTLDPL